MRVLMATRGSSGHIGPLAPFGHACMRAGHEVLVSAQRQHQGNVERAGLACAPVDDPPDHEWKPLLGQFAQMDMASAHELVVAEFFASIDVRAALPGLRATVESWRPDVMVRESWEFASTLVAEQHGIPLVRVGLGTAGVEAESIDLAAAALDRFRADLGMPPDPAGDRLRDSPYLTMVPEPLEDPAVPAPTLTHRFRAPAPEAVPSLTDWWPGNDDPLVYMSFGSVAAQPHLPYFPALYRAAIEALAQLPVRALVTVGNDGDPHELDPLPANVHVESWVPQGVAAARSAAIVCHGGYGSTLGALAPGCRWWFCRCSAPTSRPTPRRWTAPVPASLSAANERRGSCSTCPIRTRSAACQRPCSASWPTPLTAARPAASPTRSERCRPWTAP